MQDKIEIAHLPLHCEVHQDVRWVHQHQIEPLESAWRGIHCLKSVHDLLNTLNHSIRSREAISQLKLRILKDLYLTLESPILQPVDEAKYLSSCIGGIDRGPTCNIDYDGAKRPFTTVLIGHPAEPVRIHLTLFIVESG